MSLNRREFIQWLAGIGSAVFFKPGISELSTPQHRRIIPSSGEQLPVIGLGTWMTFGINPNEIDALNQRERVLREFFQRGGGVLDSSPMYGNAEQVIGLCLKRIGHYKGLFSATKVWTHGYRQGYLQMEHSRLLWGLPRLDLIQVHNLMDWKTHLQALQSMKAEGKVRYIGVTTSHGRRHEELTKIMRKEKLDFVQFTYNLLDREAEQYLLPFSSGYRRVWIRKPRL